MRTHFDARTLLLDRRGRELKTVTGKINRILEVSETRVLVQTQKSPDGRWVAIREVQHALDLLERDSLPPISVETVGHRSSFIFAVLRTLPGVKVSCRPLRVFYPEH